MSSIAWERFQPCVLDRLTDDQPSRREKEAPQEQVVSLSRLRDSILRDLIWLLNSSPHGNDADLDPFPYVKNSVLNYGLKDFTGSYFETIDIADLRQRIHRAITIFEPRIIASTLQIKIGEADLDLTAGQVSGGNLRALMRQSTGDKDQWHHMPIVISGRIWAKPVPGEFLLRTELDLEIGELTFDQVRYG